MLEAPVLTLPVGDRDHALGPAGAPVTLVQYGDFECPYCGAAYPVIKDIQSRMGDNLRFVFRNFPITTNHPHALRAAEAAEAAGAQGKFWEMHDLLFANQLHLKSQNLRSYAERLHLDMSRYTAEMDDEIYRQRVREHIESGRRSGVRSTPGIFVNDAVQDVSAGMQPLFDKVQEILSQR